MQIDWDHDDRPTWAVIVDFTTECAWDHLDRRRLADELTGTRIARDAKVSAGELPLDATARLRLKAEDFERAARTAVMVTETAAARLGTPLAAVACRSASAHRRSFRRGLLGGPLRTGARDWRDDG